jgi:2-hydroxychromene-2-carboxylate isomerase
MGEVITLADRRKARAARSPRRAVPRAEFFFDLSCPFSYLAAERVERSFAIITWRPASAAALQRTEPGADPAHLERFREAAETRASALRLPLQWPDRSPAEVPAAMRAAAFAAEHGRGAEFVLAAGRLAFCGGFDLDDPEILAEAAAAAGVGLEDCRHAAGDVTRDGVIEANGRRLLAAGADRLPALRIGRSLVWGEDRVSAATQHARASVTAATTRGFS